MCYYTNYQSKGLSNTMQNVHKYTVKTTKEEILPNGRFLKQDELLQEGDLYLSMQAVSESVHERNIGTMVCSYETKSWWRPDAIKAEQRPTVTYRFLNEGGPGGECNINDVSRPLCVWVPAKNFIGWTVSCIPAKNQNFRRAVENKAESPKKAKYRMLQPAELIQTGDQHYYVPTRRWRNVVASIGYTVKRWPTLSSFNSRRFRRKN